MPKVTQNRILGDDGSTIRIGNSAASVTAFLTKFDALRYCQATEKVVDDAGNPVIENGKQKIKAAFNADGTPKMSARPRSGYTQYFNNDGFTNPISPESLSPQGIGKLMAKLIQVSAVIIRAGGKDADDMTAVLAGIDDYRTVVADEVDKTAEHSEMEEALKTLTKAAKGDVNAAQAKLATFLASKGMTAPSPTLIAEIDTVLSEPSVTVAEAAEAIATATEAEQDGATEVDAAPEPTAEELAFEAELAAEAEAATNIDNAETVEDGELVAVAETTEDIGEPTAVDETLTTDGEPK